MHQGAVVADGKGSGGCALQDGCSGKISNLLEYLNKHLHYDFKTLYKI